MAKVRAEREQAVQRGFLDRFDVYLEEPLVSIEPDCNVFRVSPTFTFASEWVEEPVAAASAQRP
jgi:hypothetical protein